MTRFLLTQRSAVDFYPPVLNQIELLAELGIVETVFGERDLPGGRSRVIRKLKSLVAAANFSRRLSNAMSLDPSIIIAFEPEAASIVLRKPATRARRVVHLHEMPVAEEYGQSVMARMAFDRAMRLLPEADLVIVPDRHRAEAIRDAFRLPSTPEVVMNCPRRLEEVPAGGLRQALRQRGVETSSIVHYHGAIGPDHNLPNIIKSMRYWPSNSVFALTGDETRYEPILRRVAVACDVNDRVIFLGRAPYPEVLQRCADATVGVTFLEPTRLNWELSAGASNKRFEYAALGIPQVTNTGPGIDELFGRPQIASAVPFDDVAAIGNAVNAYLSSETLRRATGLRARSLHLDRYNYETQFRPVMNRLLEMIGGADAIR